LSNTEQQMNTNPGNSVVHLTLRYDDTELAVGTGVLYRKDHSTYLVTAWHNVTGRHSLTLKPLDKHCGLPNNLVAYIACKNWNTTTTVGYCRRPFTIPLENLSQTFYYIHPQGWPRVDVVAIPINTEYPYESEYTHPNGEKLSVSIPMRMEASGVGLNSDIECIQDAEPTSVHNKTMLEQNLEVTEDLFILGYPEGIIDIYGQPLWKRATVATEQPYLGWNKQKRFLVDCASRKGMSGAPVLFHSKSGVVNSPRAINIGNEPLTLFHGIYVGRIGDVSEFEAQIGTVWQRRVVDEIIEKRIFAPLSSQLEASVAEIREALDNNWPPTADYATSILGKGRYADAFTYHLMELLGGRINPNKMRELILEYAREKLKTNDTESSN
jgi:hypothetical protein